MVSRALVLGGGGVAGIAWEVGLLASLADAGVDLGDADLVVGTSAGSVVGAMLTSGRVGLAQLYANQVDPAAASAEQPVVFDGEQLMTGIAQAVSAATGARDARARIGAVALAAPTGPERARREIIAARLGVDEWPRRRLVVTAVDTGTGEFVAFDRESGVGLVDAVAASCAVPGVWPPVTIGGRRYMDGGIRSIVNADLARGCERVLIVAPLSPPPGGLLRSVDDEARELAEGSEVLVVHADEAARAAFGANPLDPATRGPSARAGRAQAAAVADDVRALWTRP